jgi:hypothetical protein
MTRRESHLNLGKARISALSLAMLAVFMFVVPLALRAEADANQANLISNGTFEGGTQTWSCHACTVSAVSPGQSGTKAAQIKTNRSDTQAQFYTFNLPLQPNTQYELHFWAKSSGQDIQVNLLKHGSPYTNYGLSKKFDLTTKWQEFGMTFTTKGFSQPVSDARLRFLTPRGSGIDYSIDSITLTAVGSPPPGGSPTPTPPPGGSPTPPPTTGAEIVIFDWNKPVTTLNRGFPWDQEDDILYNRNLISPTNYGEGTFYYRAEISGMPASKNMKLQFCIWQPAANDTTKPYKDPYKLENCGSLQSISYQGNKVVATWSQKVQDLWKKNGIIIDWSRPRFRNGVAIKNSSGLPVSNYNGWNWNGEDPNKWYPMDLRFTVVMVEKGKSFSGWDRYIK